MPKTKALSLTRLSLAGLLFSGVLAAQAPVAGNLDFEVKLKAGGLFGNLKDDLHKSSSYALGLEGGYWLNNSGGLIGELDFFFVDGANFDGQAPSSVWYNTATPTPGATLDFVSGSADVRKNKLEGFSLRGGYFGKITETFTWQAGLSLDDLKFTHEVVGTLNPLVGGAQPVDGNGNIYFEGLSTSSHKAKLNLGAFAGVKARIGENYSLEANIVSLGYTKLNYVPFTYSGQSPVVQETTRHGFVFEIGFGMKL